MMVMTARTRTAIKKGLNNGDLISNGEGGHGMVEDKDDADSDVGEVETDSDDFTDSEDDTVEFMPDGEQVRKCKRGFKILQNCKRFWKVDSDDFTDSEDDTVEFMPDG